MSTFKPDDAENTRFNLPASRKQIAPKAGMRIGLWVGIWFIVGLTLRLSNLTLKAAWMDEVATTLFSLGNYSRLIPLNDIISLEQILRPLAVTPGTTAQDVVRHLLVEDNHPPTYFVLAHWWMKLFPSVNGYASLWGARSLSAFFGAIAVPATYLLARFSFQNFSSDASENNPAEEDNTQTTALICAALMAVSPFGIFMAQEARHYTLAILCAIASLACFVLTAKAIQHHKPPKWRTILTWIAINTVGLTVHFFVGLTLMAEGMTLLLMLIQQCCGDKSAWAKAHWKRTYAAALGTAMGALLWLPILANFYGSPQTSFLKSEGKSWQFWINPIVQSVASWLYTILSPVTGGYGWPVVVAIVVTCFLLLAIYAPLLMVTLRRSLAFQWNKRSLQPGIVAIGGFFIMANLLFLLICYSTGFDITRGHRYSFVFFPSVILLVGVGLAPFWQEEAGFVEMKLPLIRKSIKGRQFVSGVFAIALFGSLVITNHYSSLKFYRPERFIALIQANSSNPVILGADTIVTEQPSVIGIEIMSVAWEIERQLGREKKSQIAQGNKKWIEEPRFIIAETNLSKGLNAKDQLTQSLAAEPNSFDLWLLSDKPDLTDIQCQQKEEGSKGSFVYTHYTCAGTGKTS